MDPVVLFFLLGVIAKLAKSDLRLPEALYETLSIFLLLAIGLKGGVELARVPFASVAVQAISAAMTKDVPRTRIIMITSLRDACASRQCSGPHGSAFRP